MVFLPPGPTQGTPQALAQQNYFLLSTLPSQSQNLYSFVHAIPFI